MTGLSCRRCRTTLLPQEESGTNFMAWIKLTGPRGTPVYVNVDQVTCVRPDTQIPGAKAELDLSSGTFQGVQEDVAQVMQAIAAATKTSIPGA
jgi:hypothetical protein